MHHAAADHIALRLADNISHPACATRTASTKRCAASTSRTCCAATAPSLAPLVLCKQYDHYSDDGETSESKPLDVDDADYLDLDTLLRSKFLGMP